MERLLMTKEEMIQRLGDGEDPLDLVIDKWRRIVDYFEDPEISQPHYDEEWLYEASSGNNCAFCWETRLRTPSLSFVLRCEFCPFFAVHGDRCDGNLMSFYDDIEIAILNEADFIEDAPWIHVRDAIFEKRFYPPKSFAKWKADVAKKAQRMLDCLKRMR